MCGLWPGPGWGIRRSWPAPGPARVCSGWGAARTPLQTPPPAPAAMPALIDPYSIISAITGRIHFTNNAQLPFHTSTSQAPLVSLPTSQLDRYSNFSVISMTSQLTSSYYQPNNWIILFLKCPSFLFSLMYIEKVKHWVISSNGLFPSLLITVKSIWLHFFNQNRRYDNNYI